MTRWDARTDVGPYEGTMDKDFEKNYQLEQKGNSMKGVGTDVTPLGSGSDFTVFLQRLGVCHLYCTPCD